MKTFLVNVGRARVQGNIPLSDKPWPHLAVCSTRIHQERAFRSNRRVEDCSVVRLPSGALRFVLPRPDDQERALVLVSNFVLLSGSSLEIAEGEITVVAEDKKGIGPREAREALLIFNPGAALRVARVDPRRPKEQQVECFIRWIGGKVRLGSHDEVFDPRDEQSEEAEYL